MDAVLEGAVIVAAVGLVFTGVKALISRAVGTQDAKNTEIVADNRALKHEVDALKERMLQIEGTVNSAWGLVPAVSKLDQNVEKLTHAVEHIGATVETLMRFSTPTRG